jgi:hypothetical protein
MDGLLLVDNKEGEHIDEFIQIHYEYLLSIKETVQFRAAISQIIHKVAFVIYIIFFFSVPE